MDETNVTVDVIVQGPETRDISAELQSLGFQPTPTSRDVETILTLTSSALGIANALLSLRSSLRTKPNSAAITVEVASGATLQLNTATEQQIQNFIRRE
jgi:hypothetical protein